MWLYIIIWLLLLLASKYPQKKVFYISLFLLSLLAGLRGNVIGFDTHIYNDIFSWIKEGTNYPIEPSWYYLNKYVGLLGGGFNFFLWVVSFLTLFILGIALVRCSPSPIFSLFLYYSLYAYLNSFNGMRQFLAISLVIAGYTYLPNLKKFLMCVLVAASFHFSAIFSLFALFYRFLVMKCGIVIIILLISFLLGLVLNDELFSLLTGPYAQYLDSDFGYRENLISAVILVIFMDLLFCWCFFTSTGAFKQSIWTKIFFFAIVLINATLQLKLGARVILYFTLVQILYFPNYLNCNIVKNKLLLKSIVIVYVAIVFMKILILGNLGEYSVYPYKFFFE